MNVCLPIRTWASLDMALDFFRQAPEEVRAGRLLSRYCRHLRRRLHQAGLHASYRAIGSTTFGKPLQRLVVTGPLRGSETLALPFRRRTVGCLAQACLILIKAQANATLEPLLDYEAEEILSARAFLTALRTSGLKLAAVAGRQRLRWHRGSGLYLLPPLLAAHAPALPSSRRRPQLAIEPIVQAAAHFESETPKAFHFPASEGAGPESHD